MGAARLLVEISEATLELDTGIANKAIWLEGKLTISKIKLCRTTDSTSTHHAPRVS